MRRSLIVVLILCILAVAALEVAGILLKKRLQAPPPPGPQAPSAVPALPKPLPRVGEKIVYDVKLGALKLGQSVFRQVPNEKVGETDAEVFIFETKFARFSDTEKIFADPETFLPLRVERKISIWPRKEDVVEEYDQKAFKVRLSRNGRHEEIKGDCPLQNAVLLPFSLRQESELGPGWKMRVNLPTQKFTVLYAGDEKLKVPAGEFETWHFKSDPDKFEVWVTQKEPKIPVKIRGTGAVGYTMYMSSYTPPPPGTATERERKEQ